MQHFLTNGALSTRPCRRADTGVLFIFVNSTCTTVFAEIIGTMSYNTKYNIALSLPVIAILKRGVIPMVLTVATCSDIFRVAFAFESIFVIYTSSVETVVILAEVGFFASFASERTLAETEKSFLVIFQRNASSVIQTRVSLARS